MAQGDHIYVHQRFRGIPFQHHGIDLGDGTVVHLAPEQGERIALLSRKAKFSVRRETLEQFTGGKPVHVVKHEQPLPPAQVAAAALGYVGTGSYDLLENNCEHFATLCATGKPASRQVDFSHSTAVSLTSAATKGAWAVSSRVAAKLAIKTAAKPHPLSLLADGVEAIATASGCAAGLSAEKTRKLAKAGGELTAIAVGCVVGGPVGGAVSLAVHRSSTAVAEHLCSSVRTSLALLKQQS